MWFSHAGSLTLPAAIFPASFASVLRQRVGGVVSGMVCVLCVSRSYSVLKCGYLCLAGAVGVWLTPVPDYVYFLLLAVKAEISPRSVVAFLLPAQNRAIKLRERKMTSVTLTRVKKCVLGFLWQGKATKTA